MFYGSKQILSSFTEHKKMKNLNKTREKHMQKERRQHLTETRDHIIKRMFRRVLRP